MRSGRTTVAWWGAIACSLSMWGCDDPPPYAPVHTPYETARPQEAPVPFTAACAALPSELQDDLTIQYSTHHYERPEELYRFVLHLKDTPCRNDLSLHMRRFYPERSCVPMEPEALRTLITRLRGERLQSIEVRPLPPWPHAGGDSIDVWWTRNGEEQTCRIGDVTHVIEVRPEHRMQYRNITRILIDEIRRRSVH